jgi:DNA-binding CsgD family transcriptional regulator/PAS domain-containing protein
MATIDDPGNVVALLYDTALHPQNWPTAMQALADVLQARRLSVVRIRSRDGAVVCLHQHGHDPAAQAAYMSYYHRIDPTVAVAAGAATGQWLVGPDWLSPQQPSNAEYVHDYCRPFDLRWISGARLSDDANHQTFFAVQRGYGDQPFDDAAGNAFAALHGHLARALTIGHELRALGQDRLMLAEAMDALPYASWVVDERLSVRHANRQAEQLMGTASGWDVHHGRLALASAAQHGRLAAAVRQACRTSQPRGDEMVCDIGRRRWHLRVVPVAASAPSTLDGSRPMAWLLLGEPSAQRFDPAALARRLDLTSAEGQLLAALAGGSTLAQVAAQRGTRIATVRSQLHGLLQKTGCTNQAGLVAMAYGLPPDRVGR